MVEALCNQLLGCVGVTLDYPKDLVSAAALINSLLGKPLLQLHLRSQSGEFLRTATQ